MFKKICSIVCCGVLCMACLGFVSASAEGAVIPYANQPSDPSTYPTASVSRSSWSGVGNGQSVSYTITGGAYAAYIGQYVKVTNGNLRADYGAGCNAPDTNSCFIEAPGSKRKYTLYTNNNAFTSGYHVTRAYWK